MPALRRRVPPNSHLTPHEAMSFPAKPDYRFSTRPSSDNVLAGLPA